VVGKRIHVGSAEPGKEDWHQIVGVIEDFPAATFGATDPGDPRGKFYLPAPPGEVQGSLLLARVRGGDGSALATRIRAIAAGVDPTLQLREVQTLETVYSALRRETMLSTLALALVISSVFLLSTAGIYALLSFTVMQRRREIGVRSALGGDARLILASVIWRAARQVAIGAGAGLLFVIALNRVADGALLQGRGLVIVPGVMVFMVIVGLAAAAGPARRGLRIQPTEALRSD
jgi:hypothetical protein